VVKITLNKLKLINLELK